MESIWSAHQTNRKICWQVFFFALTKTRKICTETTAMPCHHRDSGTFFILCINLSFYFKTAHKSAQLFSVSFRPSTELRAQIERLRKYITSGNTWQLTLDSILERAFESYNLFSIHNIFFLQGFQHFFTKERENGTFFFVKAISSQSITNV